VDRAWDEVKIRIVEILQSAAKLKGVRTDAFKVIKEERDNISHQIDQINAKNTILLREQKNLSKLEVSESLLLMYYLT